MGLAAFVATAVLMAGAQSAMAGRAHPGFYGVFYQAQGKAGKDVRKMQDAGAKHVKMALRWPTVESRQGEFHWETYDKLIGNMASRGIQVLPMFYASPRWVENKASKPPLGDKSSRRAWKNFVTRAVNRYGRNGTYWTDPLEFAMDHPGKAPKPIKAWQVWNEPNLENYFSTKKRRVAKYANLLQLTHDAIKPADRKAKVVLGGLVGNGKPSGSLNGWTFLDKLYKQKGARRKFDVAALHPYSSSIHYMKKWVHKFHRALRSHGDGKKAVWITELSWGSDPPDRIGFNKGPRGQKRILTRAFQTFWRTRHKYSTRRVYWFALRDPKHGNPRCSFCGSAGLLKTNFDKKPSWKAFKSFTGG
jgi:hypothetical protein